MSRATKWHRKTIEDQEPPQPRTVIWCSDPADVPAAIIRMLRAGELRPEDIHTCVHWKRAGVRPVPHEVALKELD